MLVQNAEVNWQAELRLMGNAALGSSSAEPVAYQNNFNMSVARLRRSGLQQQPPDTGTPLPVFRTMQSLNAESN